MEDVCWMWRFGLQCYLGVMKLKERETGKGEGGEC